MAELRDVILAKKRAEQQFARDTIVYTGKIVVRNGTVRVPGVHDHVWVLPNGDGEPEAVYNRRVKARAGLWVTVGYAPKSKVLEILSTNVDISAGYEPTAGLDVGEHAASHMKGDDPVWVDRRMIIDQLYLSPGSGLAVNVSPLEYDLARARQYFPGKLNLDISAAQPAAGLACYVLVYLDTADNTVKTTAGASSPDFGWIIPAKPDTPAGGIASAYVRLDGSQAAILEADIIDARRIVGQGRGGGWPLGTKTIHPTNADANYSTIQDAINSVATGGTGVFHVGPGPYTEDLTIASKTIILLGMGADPRQASLLSEAVLITGQVTVTSDTVNEGRLAVVNAKVFGQVLASAPIADSKAPIELFLYGSYPYNGVTNPIDIDGRVRLIVRDCDVTNGAAGTAIDADLSNEGSYEVTIDRSKINGDIVLGTGTTLAIYDSTYGTITGGTVERNDILTGQPVVVTGGALADGDGISWDAGSSAWITGPLAAAGGWPSPGKAMIGTVSYNTVEDAQTAASAGDTIKIGEGTFTLASGLSANKALTYVALDPARTILTRSTNSSNTISATADCRFINLTISNTGAGTEGAAITVSSSAVVELYNCIVSKTGAANVNRAVYFGAGTVRLYDCQVTASGATTNRAVANDTADGAAEIYGGRISGGTTDLYSNRAGTTFALFGPVLVNANYSLTTAPTGEYLDTNGVTRYPHNTAPSVGMIIRWNATTNRWEPGYNYYLAASDGSPDPALSANAAGDLTPAGHYLASSTYVVQAGWFDYPLSDGANSSGVADHFKAVTATYPPAWTEVDAALANDTGTNVPSAWTVKGNSAELSWDYKVKSNISLESLGASVRANFHFGPVLFKDGAYTADLDYYIALHRNNAGAIDTATYIKVHLHWNSASSIWQIRAEEKDGTTAHTSSYITLNNAPLVQPLYFRLQVFNSAQKTIGVYWGTSPVVTFQQILLYIDPTSAPTWGNIWLRLNQSRGNGVADFISFGTIDYSNVA